MTTSLRFQFYIHRWILVILPAIVLGVVALCVLFPEIEFLSIYYSMLPSFPIFAAAGAGLGAFTAQMNFALSMGEVRRQFFFASQISALFMALFGTLMVSGILTLDLNADVGFYFDMMHQMHPINLFFIVFCNYIVGCAIGIVVSTNRTLGIILLSMAGVVLGLVSSLGILFFDDVASYENVAAISTVACAVVTLGCEWLLWKRTQTYVVK